MIDYLYELGNVTGPCLFFGCSLQGIPRLPMRYVSWLNRGRKSETRKKKTDHFAFPVKSNKPLGLLILTSPMVA